MREVVSIGAEVLLAKICRSCPSNSHDMLAHCTGLMRSGSEHTQPLEYSSCMAARYSQLNKSTAYPF